MIKKYFERRKEASRIHRLLYDIQKVQLNCSDGLFKGLNEGKYNKLANAVENVIKELEKQWEEVSLEERMKLVEGGLFEKDIHYNPFEWLRRFELLLRKELKGKMFMFCWQGVCITLWEIPFWIGLFYLISQSFIR